MTPRRAGGPPSPDPMPAVATAVRLPWDAVVEDPVAALAEARSRIGDTFVVDSDGDRYLFLFSPLGVAALYGLPEEEASKGVADWRMLRRKLPDEVFDGRRVLPHQLFGREDVAAYLRNVETGVEAATDELCAEGEVDLFALSRRLGHRVGLASWGGPGAAEGERFETLARAFDRLDGSESFVHPDAMAHVAATDKAEERAALAEVTAQLGLGLQRRRACGDQGEGETGGEAEGEHALFDRVAAAWADADPGEAGTGVCLDVTLIHVASMSNLFAALGWHIIDLLEHPDEAELVRLGDAALAERCALESTRMAQRSIMARFTLAPFTIELEEGPLDVPPGLTVATLLPLTNRSAAPGLDRWDPARWNRRRLRTPNGLAAAELVTVFGHGGHSCPARPFSLSAMTLTSRSLLRQFRWEPSWSAHPDPVPAQIGGVARAAGPCRARYRRR
jgi:cytochrome P450